MERSASEPRLALRVGNLAKSGKAQKLDNPGSLDGRVHVRAGRLNWGSPVPSSIAGKLEQAETQGREDVVRGGRRVRSSDEPSADESRQRTGGEN